VIPGGARPLGLLLAPGAGADRTQPSLMAIDDALGARGVAVTRMDFPYRRAGRRAPDRAPVLVASVVAEAAELAPRTDPLVLGGRSMGGRMCSLAVAEGLPAAGLVLISYPLHPPGRPDKRRDAHFPSLGVPCLFLSGTRDAFASPDELTAAVTTIPGPVTLQWLEGRDHGLRGRDVEVAGIVVDWVEQTFPGRLHPAPG
jgi:predicted alpha/beta-hydrolase family hydrolase